MDAERGVNLGGVMVGIPKEGQIVVLRGLGGWLFDRGDMSGYEQLAHVVAAMGRDEPLSVDGFGEVSLVEWWGEASRDEVELAMTVVAVTSREGAGADGVDLSEVMEWQEIRMVLLTAEEEVELAKYVDRGLKAKQTITRTLTEPDWEAHLPILRGLTQLMIEGKAAEAAFVGHNIGLVKSVAKRYMDQGVPKDDLEQEGFWGLLRAIAKYDHTRGYRFSTYATWWIRQAVDRAVADQSRTIRIPVHMNERIRLMYGVARRLEQEVGREPSDVEIAEVMELEPDKVKRLRQIGVQPMSLDMPVGESDDALGEFVEDEGENMETRGNEALLARDQALAELTPRQANVLRCRFGFYGEAQTLEAVGQKLGLSRERIRQIEAGALKRLRHPRYARYLRDYLV